jgi:hypothetical protein
MAEGLLLRHEFDVVTAGVLGQTAHLFGRELASLGRRQRGVPVGEDVLHVQAEHVELELSRQADQPLELCVGGDGAAADVQGEAAVAQRGPVGDGDRGHARAGAHELAQRLRAIEHAGRRARGDENAAGAGMQPVAFLVFQRATVQAESLNLAIRRRIARANQPNHRAFAGGNDSVAAMRLLEFFYEGFRRQPVF